MPTWDSCRSSSAELKVGLCFRIIPTLPSVFDFGATKVWFNSETKRKTGIVYAGSLLSKTIPPPGVIRHKVGGRVPGNILPCQALPTTTLSHLFSSLSNPTPKRRRAQHCRIDTRTTGS